MIRAGRGELRTGRWQIPTAREVIIAGREKITEGLQEIPTTRAEMRTTLKMMRTTRYLLRKKLRLMRPTEALLLATLHFFCAEWVSLRMASSSSPAHSTKSAAPIPLKRLCSALGNSIRWQILVELAYGRADAHRGNGKRSQASVAALRRKRPTSLLRMPLSVLKSRAGWERQIEWNVIAPARSVEAAG